MLHAFPPWVHVFPSLALQHPPCPPTLSTHQPCTHARPHLSYRLVSDFAGIEIPTTLEQLETEIERVNVNVFTLEEAAAAIVNIDAQVIAENSIGEFKSSQHAAPNAGSLTMPEAWSTFWLAHILLPPPSGSIPLWPLFACSTCTVYGLVFGMTGASVLSVALFCLRDAQEAKQRAARLKRQSSLSRIGSLSRMRSSMASNILAPGHAPSADQQAFADSGASVEEAVAQAAEELRVVAAIEIQRIARGMAARRFARAVLAAGQATRAMVKRTFRQVMAEVGERLRSDHSMLGAACCTAAQARAARLHVCNYVCVMCCSLTCITPLQLCIARTITPLWPTHPSNA